MESVPKSEVENGSGQLRSLYDGLSMTETQLLTVSGRTVVSVHSVCHGIFYEEVIITVQVLI